MWRNLFISILVALSIASYIPSGYSRGHGHSYSHGSHSYSSHSYGTRSYRGYSSGSHHSYGSHRSTYATGVSRDSHGRIKRSSSSRSEFMNETGYPHGRNGYVIDHRVPLKRGGSDTPGNMQWQTKEAAKQKDKWE